MPFKETKPYDSRTIVLYPDKAELFKKVWSSLLGAPLVPPLLIAWSSGNPWLRFASLLVGLPLLLWESTYLLEWFRLLRPKPAVIVNEVGFTYDDPMASWLMTRGLQIRWEEIEAIFPCELTIRGTKRTKTFPRFLAIIPKDSAEFSIQHKLLYPRRWLLLLLISFRSINTPFMIFETIISPCSLDELLAQVRARYQHEIEAHGIEIGEERKISIG
jgi:hypothetical protein